MHKLRLILLVVLLAGLLPNLIPAVIAQDDGMIEDFEDPGAADRWGRYTGDEDDTLICERVRGGVAGDYGFHFQLDLSPMNWSGCGRAVDTTTWADAQGLRFFWRSDTPGMAFSIALLMDGGFFSAHMSTQDTGWTERVIPWSHFGRNDSDAVLTVADLPDITGMNLDVGSNQPQQGNIWIDDIRLAYEVPEDPVIEPLEPTATEALRAAYQAVPVDKFALWVDGPHLRGTNIWQTVIDQPNDFWGPYRVAPPYTQEDFDQLAAMGANWVNISGPGLFTTEPPYEVDEEIQTAMDNLLEMLARADLFAVITVRLGPGRPVDFAPDNSNHIVWTDPAARQGWIDMWRYMAERYRDHPVVVGYDLMCEPNANQPGGPNLWRPDDFYPAYAGSDYDWNDFYPPVVAAIREVDPDTPILVAAMNYGAVDWLPYLEPIDDPHMVYLVHQYHPGQYTHQEPGDDVGYPGWIDMDYDGTLEQFDRAWLGQYMGIVEAYQTAHGVPISANEFGLRRWAPGAATWLDDLIGLFEVLGIEHAPWSYNPSYWEGLPNHDFNYWQGTDPASSHMIDNPLTDVLFGYWARNVARPSNVTQDADGDRVPDVIDACPDTAGVVTASGCPDADGDGVGDPSDACPNDTGHPQTGGCRFTGTVGVNVNLRQGPGTDHAIQDVVQAGNAVDLIGRNAAGDWLRVLTRSAQDHPMIAWMSAPLVTTGTDLDLLPVVD